MSAPHIILDNLPSLCQKLSDLVEVWRSYNKNNFACFFRHGVHNGRVFLWKCNQWGIKISQSIKWLSHYCYISSHAGSVFSFDGCDFICFFLCQSYESLKHFYKKWHTSTLHRSRTVSCSLLVIMVSVFCTFLRIVHDCLPVTLSYLSVWLQQ